MSTIEPLFVEGGVYQSKSHGLVTYRGIDSYLGQVTLMFDSKYGRTYWLPEALHHHFAEFEKEGKLD